MKIISCNHDVVSAQLKRLHENLLIVITEHKQNYQKEYVTGRVYRVQRGGEVRLSRPLRWTAVQGCQRGGGLHAQRDQQQPCLGRGQRQQQQQQQQRDGGGGGGEQAVEPRLRCWRVQRARLLWTKLPRVPNHGQCRQVC